MFSLAKLKIPTFGSPKMSDRITGASFSLPWKDYDSAIFVLDDPDAYLSWGFAYSSLPEHTVRFFADRYLCCLHSL
jgi:hypothetical protein